MVKTSPQQAQWDWSRLFRPRGDAALRQNTSETSDKRSTAAQCTRAERIQKGLKTLTWDPLRVMDGLAHQPRPLEPVTRFVSMPYSRFAIHESSSAAHTTYKPCGRMHPVRVVDRALTGC